VPGKRGKTDDRGEICQDLLGCLRLVGLDDVAELDDGGGIGGGEGGEGIGGLGGGEAVALGAAFDAAVGEVGVLRVWVRGWVRG
jgi:hypothetical protein